jgi:hypothetical protein
MSKPTYTELEQAVRLLFTSYVRTVAAVQAEWASNKNSEDASERACKGLFSTLERDADGAPDYSVCELIDHLRHMGVVRDDQTTST